MKFWKVAYTKINIGGVRVEVPTRMFIENHVDLPLVFYVILSVDFLKTFALYICNLST